MENHTLQLPCTVVLIGLMGAGKSCVGRRLAHRLNVPFVDADAEIEAAAGCTIGEIFERFGESFFRDRERRVMQRLLDGPVCILASGGGAFMNPETRALIARKAISVWLRADLDLLVKRTSGRDSRPLLNGPEPRRVLADLIAQRHPVYAGADVVVDTLEHPPEATAESVCHALTDFIGRPRVSDRRAP